MPQLLQRMMIPTVHSVNYEGRYPETGKYSADYFELQNVEMELIEFVKNVKLVKWVWKLLTQIAKVEEKVIEPAVPVPNAQTYKVYGCDKPLISLIQNVNALVSVKVSNQKTLNKHRN